MNKKLSYYQENDGGLKWRVDNPELLDQVEDVVQIVANVLPHFAKYKRNWNRSLFENIYDHISQGQS